MSNSTDSRLEGSIFHYYNDGSFKYLDLAGNLANDELLSPQMINGILFYWATDGLRCITPSGNNKLVCSAPFSGKEILYNDGFYVVRTNYQKWSVFDENLEHIRDISVVSPNTAYTVNGKLFVLVNTSPYTTIYAYSIATGEELITYETTTARQLNLQISSVVYPISDTRFFLGRGLIYDAELDTFEDVGLDLKNSVFFTDTLSAGGWIGFSFASLYVYGLKIANNSVTYTRCEFPPLSASGYDLLQMAKFPKWCDRRSFPIGTGLRGNIIAYSFNGVRLGFQVDSYEDSRLLSVEMMESGEYVYFYKDLIVVKKY